MIFACVGAFALVILALAALAIHIAFPADSSVMKSPSARKIDTARFSRLPDEGAGRLVEDTASDAETLSPMSQEEAILANARIPVSSQVGPAAQPLMLPLGNGESYIRALDCMTSAIYYEAANEPIDGQRAVAQVVINRLRHLAYPHSVCGVVYQGAERKTGCQFSFTCDGSLQRTPVADIWRQARGVASAALGGYVFSPVGLATHYHADYVLPYWAPTLVKQKIIGRHLFYRWPGTWGTPSSFRASYDRNEPDIWASLKSAQMDRKDLPADDMAPDAGTIQSNARPVLLSGTLPVIATETGSSEAKNQNGRVYLMSVAGKTAEAAPAPARPRSVTGGAIMPATIAPTTPQNSGQQITPTNAGQ